MPLKYLKVHMGLINKLLWGAALALMLTACTHHGHEHHTILEKISERSSQIGADEVGAVEAEIDASLIKVKGGHTGFYIPKRTEEMDLYSCAECHNKPLEQMGSSAGQKAHWDIHLNHADEHTMQCTTCHDPDMDNLQSITHTSIDFDRSYNLCGQCHSKEKEDWLGGAHGKSLNGWKSPRVAQTCVGCHNPHNPGFESRLPARYNTQKVKERN